MKTTKRLLSLLLALITLCSVIAIPAFAASTWPSLSSSGYCEMISPGKITVYRESKIINTYLMGMPAEENNLRFIPLNVN